MNRRPDACDDDDVRELVENLAGDGCCPLCGQSYRREDIRVVREYLRANRWILSMSCHCCGTGSLITAQAPQQVYVRRRPPTELTARELRQLADTAPLTSDDVLDMHIFLSQFQGDLQHLGSDPV
ncbi:MAG: hypothetical protein M1434_00440 [Chloroflexi bacterium]|nr:hypothetical protein [Chloroflexota bacterium]